MGTILIHAWDVCRYKGVYYLPFTHWIYLKEITQYYDKVILLSPCKKLNSIEESYSLSIDMFTNVGVFELPYSHNYIFSVKYFFKYLKAYKDMGEVTTYYTRYPVPFGWLQKLYGAKANRIIHYVGDPIDAAKNNPNFSFLKRCFLTNAFKPENALYNWACNGAKVYTNGHHIADKLAKKKIKATALISSTLASNDFFFEEKDIDPKNAKFIYLGYLRKAKGVETVIRSFGLYQKEYPYAKLTIIGSGEFDKELKKLVVAENIDNVTFLGHIDDRTKINNLLRIHDFFIFASLSEGSPRVVLEAMANSLVVVSTPVGSLPYEFEDMKEIVFADFNNANDFFEKIKIVANDNVLYSSIRSNAYLKAKENTLSCFIKKIFS